MDGTTGIAGWADEASDWLVDLNALPCGDVTWPGLHWTPVDCFLFEMAVFYDGPDYLGCVLRRRTERAWKAIPYTPGRPAQVAFLGDRFETMAWMEDRAYLGRS